MNKPILWDDPGYPDSAITCEVNNIWVLNDFINKAIWWNPLVMDLDIPNHGFMLSGEGDE